MEATVERMGAAPVVLLVQDTTKCDKWIDLGPKGIGTIHNREKFPRRLHPTVAFTPGRVCLGVVQAIWWDQKPSPRAERRYQGVDEKESGRWILSYQESCALQGLFQNAPSCCGLFPRNYPPVHRPLFRSCQLMTVRS